MSKTTVINLIGGPGSGKTGMLHLLMAYCKVNSIDAESSMEYAKDKIVDGIKLKPTDQVYILAKQHKREVVFYGKTDYIITDCPMWMSISYEKELSSPPYVSKSIIEKYLAHSPDVNHKFVQINRPKTYNPSGRRQDEDEAKYFDKNLLNPMLDFLRAENKTVHEFTTGDYKIEDVVKVLDIK